MQGRGSRAEFTTGVLPKIVDRHIAQIDFRERKRLPVRGGLGLIVYDVDKDAHPLVARTMCVDSPTSLSGCFDLNTELACLDTVARVFPFQDQVGMAVEIPILNKCSGVLREAGGHHVRQNARHDSRPQHVVQPIQTFFDKVRIYVVEKIVNILNRRVEVLKAKLIGQRSIFVERCLNDTVTYYYHTYAAQWLMKLQAEKWQ